MSTASHHSRQSRWQGMSASGTCLPAVSCIAEHQTRVPSTASMSQLLLPKMLLNLLLVLARKLDLVSKNIPGI